MRDIAEACGLLAGSLYSHFKSKSEILELIIGPFYDQLVPAQEAAAALEGTGAERTEDMIRRVFRVLAACNDEMTIIHYDWQDLLELDDFAAILERSNYILELWYQVIVAGIEDGTLRREIDPEMTVRIITSSLHGVLDLKRYGARPDPLAESGLDEIVNEFVLLMVSGLRSEPSPKPVTMAKRVRKAAAVSAGKSTAQKSKSAATRKSEGTATNASLSGSKTTRSGAKSARSSSKAARPA
jgi:TetR/AcrR family transcriptional regulator, cholesterol catabolism regulator